MKRLLRIMMSVAALTALAYLAGNLWAQVPGAQPTTTGVAPPAAGATRVALINMVNILKGYKKFDFYRDQIQKIAKPFEDRDTQLKKNLEGWATVARDVEQSKEKREEAEKYVMTLKRQIEDNANEGNKAISVKNDEQLVQMFREIEEATKAVARSNGIQLVLHFQEPVTPAEIYTAFNVQRKMAGCGKAGAINPMYVADGLDISAQVIATLNHSFPAAPVGSGPAPGPTPPTGG